MPSFYLVTASVAVVDKRFQLPFAISEFCSDKMQRNILQYFPTETSTLSSDHLRTVSAFTEFHPCRSSFHLLFTRFIIFIIVFVLSVLHVSALNICFVSFCFIFNSFLSILGNIHIFLYLSFFYHILTFC